MITGNKGEWSEIYTLFKLIGDQKLIAGDADLKMVENLFYPIIKIIIFVLFLFSRKLWILIVNSLLYNSLILK